MEIRKNRVMELSNLTSVFHNHDYDGDNMVAAALQSEEAKEDFKYMFINNNIEFEQRDQLLFDWEHEAIYAAFMITKIDSETPKTSTTVETFTELREKFINIESIYKNDLLITVKNLDKTLSLTDWLINRCLHDYNWDESSTDFIIFQEKTILNKKNLNKLLWNFYKYLKNTDQTKFLWDRGHELDKFLMEIGTTIDYCNPSFDLSDFAVESETILDYKKNLIQTEPYLAFHQNMILFEDYVSPEVKKNPNNILYKVFESGARLKSVQLLKAASNTGIPTNIYGKAKARNIEHSLLDGLTQKEYYETGDSARLALMQRQDSIPRGGELQRKFFFSTGILQYLEEEEDCQKDIPLENKKTINIKILNFDHLKTLNHRWFIDEELKQDIHIDIEDPDRQDYYKSLIGKTFRFYSPQKCQLQNFGICKKCMGSKGPTSKHIGASLGSYIAEGIIQSVLRAHHFGGAFITEINKEILDVLKNSKIVTNSIDDDASDMDNIGEEVIYNNSKEELEKIVNYLFTKYHEKDIEVTIIESEESKKTDYKFALKIKVINLPFNDDSVKILTSIVSLIDKNRSKDKFIEPEIIYENLVEVMTQNNLLSVYFELILSLIFYDEDENLVKYSNKPAVSQIALKNIIEKLDPKLSIFYNFSNRAITNVYKNKNISANHMYNELLEMYY